METATSEPISAFVECFWSVFVDPDGQGTPEHRVLPDGCGTLSFRLGPQSKMALRPPSLQPFRAPATPGEHSVGVRFRPGALARLDLDVLQQLTHREFGDIRPADAWTIIETELWRAAHSAPDPDERVRTIVTTLRQTTGQASVQQLADEVQLSERQLERLCLKSLRLGPKAFARTVRIQAVLRSLIAQPDLNLSWVAAQFGYADQAHMGREFIALGALTPSEYVRTLKEHAIEIAPVSDLF